MLLFCALVCGCLCPEIGDVSDSALSQASAGCGLLDGKDQDHCYQAIAVEAGDPRGCGRIEGHGWKGQNPPKDKCYLLIAEKTGEISACDKIKGGMNSYTQKGCREGGYPQSMVSISEALSGEPSKEEIERARAEIESTDQHRDELSDIQMLMHLTNKQRLAELDSAGTPTSSGADTSDISKNLVNEGETYTLTDVEGDIYIKDSTGRFRKAQEGEKLRPGETVYSDDGASAYVDGMENVFSTGRTVLKPNSMIANGVPKPHQEQPQQSGGILDDIKSIFSGSSTSKPQEPPPPAMTSQKNVITHVEGEVYVINSRGEKSPAKAGMSLGEDDKLVVLDDSMAKLKTTSEYEDGEVREREQQLLDNSAIHITSKTEIPEEFTAVAGGVR